MITQISYNVLIERFKAFASAHFLIKGFSHGDLSNIDIEKEVEFPWMHVLPVEVEPRAGSRLYSFVIIFADLPRDKETPAEYQRECISDCIKLAEDLLAEVQNGQVVFGPYVELDGGANIEVFINEFSHTLVGVNLQMTLSVPWDWSACDIPADFTIGGSGSGGTGSAVGITLQTNGVNNGLQSLLNLQQGTNVTIVDNGNGTVTINSTGGGGGGGTVTSVALTVPSAFVVSGSPITGAGTLAITGAGTSGDYIDGTGALQTFPSPQGLQDVITEDNQLTTNNIIDGNNYALTFDQIGSFGVNANGKLLINNENGNNKTEFSSDDLNAAIIYTDNVNNYTASVYASGDESILNTQAGAYASNQFGTVAIGVGVDGGAFPFTQNAVIIKTPAVDGGTASAGEVLTLVDAASGKVEFSTAGGGGSVTSVGLTMPAPLNPAFSVGGSPVTTSGTLAVTANGSTAQYIDGTGALQSFPALSGFVPYTGATQDVDLDANKLSAASVYIEGINGNGHLHLKHQNADATATGQSTALWADNNGDIKWKNDGNYKTTLKSSANTADRVYTFPNEDAELMPRNAAITPATKTKITYDADGLVTSGADIVAADISDSSTVGQNLLKLTNPSAITFLRVNADNTVTARTPAQVLTDLGISANIILFRDSTIYTLSNTTTNTLVWSGSIAANTFQVNDVIDFQALFQGNTPNGTAFNLRLYVNTSAAIAGATQVGRFFVSNAAAHGLFYRQMIITAIGASGNLRVFSNAATTPSAYSNTNATTTNITINTTGTLYFILAFEMGNATSTSSIQYINALISR